MENKCFSMTHEQTRSSYRQDYYLHVFVVSSLNESISSNSPDLCYDSQMILSHKVTI